MIPVMNSLVVVPTYNEVDNLPGIVDSILEHAPQTHILIVDDNSPDGTGALADQSSAAQNRGTPAPGRTVIVSLEAAL